MVSVWGVGGVLGLSMTWSNGSTVILTCDGLMTVIRSVCMPVEVRKWTMFVLGEIKHFQL